MRRQKIRRAIILISFLFFPVTLYYFSPVLIIAGAAESVVAGCALVFALQFISALLLGRAFCGWVCPAAGIQEACFMVRDRRAAGGRWDWIKYAIWAPWIATVVITAVRAGGFQKVDPLYMTESGVSVAGPEQYVVFYIVLSLIVVLALTAGRRGFCHYSCWMAPFMVLARAVRNIFRWPSLRLTADKEKCIECKRCTKDCPMSLDVQRMVTDEKMKHCECILCGTCVDVCPKDVIHFAFGPGRKENL